LNRRQLLRRLGLAAAGAYLTGGCAVAAPGSGVPAAAPHPRPRTFAPVRVAADRVIRTVAGARPYRAPGFVVRAERLDDRTVIHNYGHGGGGLSLCWGSSLLAVQLAQQAQERRCAVIGAGALGLTTARLLQDRGYDVTVYARELPPDTTSNIAGAQWSPYTVSDTAQETGEYRARFERAARLSHSYYQTLVGPAYGVRWIENFALLGAPPRPRTDALADLYPTCDVYAPGQHPFGQRWLRCFETMFIESNTFLRALTHDFLARGGRLVVRGFATRSDLLRLEETLLFNCTGMGARALFGDDALVPIKGELVFLPPQPEVDYILLAGEHYMFPRSDGILLGGSRGVSDASTEPDPAVVRRILEGHMALFGAGRGSVGAAS
jgi:D-amino-acid oxidase